MLPHDKSRSCSRVLDQETPVIPVKSRGLGFVLDSLPLLQTGTGGATDIIPTALQSADLLKRVNDKADSPRINPFNYSPVAGITDHRNSAQQPSADRFGRHTSAEYRYLFIPVIHAVNQIRAELVKHTTQQIIQTVELTCLLRFNDIESPTAATGHHSLVKFPDNEAPQIHLLAQSDKVVNVSPFKIHHRYQNPEPGERYEPR